VLVVAEESFVVSAVELLLLLHDHRANAAMQKAKEIFFIKEVLCKCLQKILCQRADWYAIRRNLSQIIQPLNNFEFNSF
jgi:hypothetical protein